MKYHFAPLILLIVLASSCQNSPEPTPAAPEIPFRVDGSLDFVRVGETLLSLDIEIADTDSLRERGMMQRTSFPPESGMLFLFDQQEIRQFWMGNTPLSLDLLFISNDSTIVDIAKYARPYSDEPIVGGAPAQFVLEVPGGFADTRGIVEGDQVRWVRH
ncbi:MAG: DUF192 domain-containing protein [Rhodothermaceae bacterium]|nr:DUF192 domain-containing protein [Rhodothermaceae bacterium]MXZ18876.1 DUF192 domain-containing protein [Rhodothermaceae bacterium]MXZ58215.1 DUF192 domain-containing protein [Rhodothermaceae bacterium]MYB92009.1 DUF192 domain-containing protein [Rhodothermaceae bacterium]MYD66767.1 DUF192 domain-containing protein [Rhodothermaceae bacterium]